MEENGSTVEATAGSGSTPQQPSRLRRLKRLVFVGCVVVISAIGLLAALGHSGQATNYPPITVPTITTPTTPQLPLTHVPPDLNIGATTSVLSGTGGFADLTVTITNLNTSKPVVWPTLYLMQNGKYLPIMGDGYGGCQPDGYGAACPAISTGVPQPEIGPGQTFQTTLQVTGSAYDPSLPVIILAGGNGVTATPVDSCSVSGGPGTCTPPPPAPKASPSTSTSTTAATTSFQTSARRATSAGASLA